MSGFLIDTNVVSETRKRNASPAAMDYLSRLESEHTYISVLTLGELRRGVVAKQATDKIMAAEFQSWLDDIEREYVGRTLTITAEIAHRWGEITSDRTRPVVDSLIAATAIVHGLTVVTRNVRDYQTLGIPVINPWN
ncbi:hypothetical protein VE25_11730 [Devosia geojensis]|uniref:Ribonuclease VapC n=1 Tax=Devosia geojensis TaxID=443610 RepID=A0A0F5FS20_9HYPH|nr:type II toxin-antitoxin system VapC family toxin [Devosia geojensis]KKB11651.1 hypothetical protein VE25_11730 [Devosia geojensis]